MLRILHVEDNADDAFLIERSLTENHLDVAITNVANLAQLHTALERGEYDLVLADSSLPGLDSIEALKLVREKLPGVPVISVSGSVSEERAKALLGGGVATCVEKDDLWQLPAFVREVEERLRLQRLNQGMSRLVQAVQELSLARDLDTIMSIVRRAARELTGADGATFVLRDGEFCYYAEEDAIEPLWKGQRFPLGTCVSGWVMLNRQPAVIGDIYVDARIPVNAYRPTFVKSLAMVPIRTESPIGAIGNYWARQRVPTSEEIQLLQALANTTSVAMENVQVYAELEKRVADRTAELEVANRELETFSYAVSHDLRTPLRAMRSFTEIVVMQAGDRLDEVNRGHLNKVQACGQKMSVLIEDLLKLAKLSRAALRKSPVDLSAMARDIMERLSAATPLPGASIRIGEGLLVEGDQGLLEVVLENLLSNAWKYSSKQDESRVEFDAMVSPEGSRVFFVRDNGAGFDMQLATRLFEPFQRLHSEKEFTGTGVGLATVQRIIHRHGGRIWAEAEVGRGATFFFELPGTTPV